MGKREIIYPSLHCQHQNDCSIKMGGGESHFNVSLIVRDKVTRQCPQTTTFEEKRGRKSKRDKEGQRGTKSQYSVHRPQLLKRKESGSGFQPKSLCLPA